MFEFIPETVENYDPGESPARKFRTRNQREGRGGFGGVSETVQRIHGAKRVRMVGVDLFID